MVNFLLALYNYRYQLYMCRRCLIIGQSFFLNDESNYIDLGGGILGCRGFFSSFRVLHGGLFMNHGNMNNTSVSCSSIHWASLTDNYLCWLHYRLAYDNNNTTRSSSKFSYELPKCQNSLQNWLDEGKKHLLWKMRHLECDFCKSNNRLTLFRLNEHWRIWGLEWNI